MIPTDPVLGRGGGPRAIIYRPGARGVLVRLPVDKELQRDVLRAMIGCDFQLWATKTPALAFAIPDPGDTHTYRAPRNEKFANCPRILPNQKPPVMAIRGSVILVHVEADDLIGDLTDNDIATWERW